LNKTKNENGLFLFGMREKEWN